MDFADNYAANSALPCPFLLLYFVDHHLSELAFLQLEEAAEAVVKVLIVPGIVPIEVQVTACDKQGHNSIRLVVAAAARLVWKVA